MAVLLLKKELHVNPDKYTMYNNAFLFRAYPEGSNKQDMSPFYLVDLRTNTAGPFSPAYDLDGFFAAASNFKDL